MIYLGHRWKRILNLCTAQKSEPSKRALPTKHSEVRERDRNTKHFGVPYIGIIAGCIVVSGRIPQTSWCHANALISVLSNCCLHYNLVPRLSEMFCTPDTVSSASIDVAFASQYYYLPVTFSRTLSLMMTLQDFASWSSYTAPFSSSSMILSAISLAFDG